MELMLDSEKLGWGRKLEQMRRNERIKQPLHSGSLND
jgi:hypothetical protein